MKLSGDCLTRLVEALDVVGSRADNVRLVRVLSGEDPPPNAKKQGDFYYLVDSHAPARGWWQSTRPTR